ncbi:MAG: MraY family glycosyltransferase [bacterium]
MFNYSQLFLIFSVSFLTVLIFTPFFISLAEKIGAVDKPNPRRVNIVPIARLGGPVLFLAFVFSSPFYLTKLDSWLPITVGAFLILALGIIDDLYNIRATWKLVWQVAVAVFMYLIGIRVEYLTKPFGDGGMIFLPDILSFFITILWIVGITNTLNLIDGLDGLAAGVTCIASIALFLVAVEKAQAGSVYLAASMIGLSAGFLRWNFYPAKIFMGDSGAYFLGFMMSVIAIEGAFKSTLGLTFLIPVLVLGIPIFDTWFAIVRRLSSGKPVMGQPDRGHIHHRLLSAGWLHRDTVMLFYIMTLALGIFSLLLIRAWKLAMLLVIAVVILIPVLIISGKILKRRHREKV